MFTFNGGADSATAIDAATGKAVGTVALGGGPEFAASDGKGHVFVNLEDKSQLVKFDPVTLKVEKTWPLAPCESPSGLAIDAEHEILVVGCHNKMMAFVDGNSGHVIGTVPIGQGVDANRFDPATGFAFASCGDGTVTVAHEDSPDKFTVVDTIYDATRRAHHGTGYIQPQFIPGQRGLRTNASGYTRTSQAASANDSRHLHAADLR